MEILENLELIDVRYEDKKAVLVFLHEEKGEIREVKFNKQDFDKNTRQFVDNETKAEMVENWCQEYFNLSFDNLNEAIGDRKTLYCYKTFNSLFPIQMVQKFEADMVGQIFQTVIKEAKDDGQKLSFMFEYNGNLYESKMQYTEFIENRQTWLVNPQKRLKQYETFEQKFHLPVSRIEELEGKEVLVEVKKAFNHTYAEIKPFLKK